MTARFCAAVTDVVAATGGAGGAAAWARAVPAAANTKAEIRIVRISHLFGCYGVDRNILLNRFVLNCIRSPAARPRWGGPVTVAFPRRPATLTRRQQENGRAAS